MEKFKLNMDDNPSRPFKGPPRSKSQLQDDSIMGTNNSSVVSKRSVERLYFPHETHFFRYFVRKPQRRSPLINRGYWLRMKAVDHVLRLFLEEKTGKRKLIINLGCGYDPLPWQCLARYPETARGSTFVDIDYRDLMLKKREIVHSTSQLNSMFTKAISSDGDIIYESEQYFQIGCDLRDIDRLSQILTTALDIQNCSVLFTAEVSITYMNVEASDTLIKWCASLSQAKFCLLEQIIPGGVEHPFAQTMMSHFDKLLTPLGAARKYPTTTDQHYRFRNLGWQHVKVRNLWELWGAPDFIGAAERRSLDIVEPFDEWEEFALFASHYFLLVADNTTAPLDNSEIDEPAIADTADISDSSNYHSRDMEVTYLENPKLKGYRRFASALPLRGHSSLQDRIGNFAGMGVTTRVNSIDIYCADKAKSAPESTISLSASPSIRMCHTTTDLGATGTLLVGGRTSPDGALVDCWLYHKWLDIWERVDDLPTPLYRHSAVNLGHGYVLVTWGRSGSQTITTNFLIWSRRRGWVACTFGNNQIPPPSFGATFALAESQRLQRVSKPRHGIFAGGISEDGVMQKVVWRWELQGFTDSRPLIVFSLLSDSSHQALIPRFGAAVADHQGQTYILGGIVADVMLEGSTELCTLTCDGDQYAIAPVSLSFPTRPLLVGVTITCTGTSLLLMGGSAVCFSFGTYWNKGCFTIAKTGIPKHHHNPLAYDSTANGGSFYTWEYLHTRNYVSNMTGEPHNVLKQEVPSQSLAVVSRVEKISRADFHHITQTAKPIIFEGLDLGSCTTKWTTSYLKNKVGAHRKVIVHETASNHMDFTTKNFSYVTKSFGDFLDQIDANQKLYLRSLSAERPSERPADITQDFPTISMDFQLPPELSMVMENAHSSPLRISGPVAMWLHYDVMANVLCQIRGCKKLLLFPPTDVKHFNFEPGASSSSVDAFAKLPDLFSMGAHPYEVVLNPGDILFLPPLWLHTAVPVSGVSIAVNVFFRNQSTGYSVGKDVYGNRDLQVYEKARQDIARILRSFDKVPEDIRSFYLHRLVEELEMKGR